MLAIQIPTQGIGSFNVQMIVPIDVVVLLTGIVILMLIRMLLSHLYERMKRNARRVHEMIRISSLDGVGVLGNTAKRNLEFLIDDRSSEDLQNGPDDTKVNPVGKRFGKKWSIKNLRKEKHIVLFLGADVDPDNTIHVDKDCESIKDVLAGSEMFHVVEKFSVKKNEIIPLITRYQPSIVHFDGHGTTDGSLAVCSAAGQFDCVTQEELKGVFNAAKAYVGLSFFDACYTESQAESAVLSVKAAIGMSGSWSVESARIFAKQFYLSLENELSVQEAYELAKEQLGMEGRKADKNTPRLFFEVGVVGKEFKFQSKTHKEA